MPMDNSINTKIEYAIKAINNTDIRRILYNGISSNRDFDIITDITNYTILTANSLINVFDCKEYDITVTFLVTKCGNYILRIMNFFNLEETNAYVHNDMKFFVLSENYIIVTNMYNKIIAMIIMGKVTIYEGQPSYLKQHLDSNQDFIESIITLNEIKGMG